MSNNSLLNLSFCNNMMRRLLASFVLFVIAASYNSHSSFTVGFVFKIRRSLSEKQTSKTDEENSDNSFQSCQSKAKADSKDEEDRRKDENETDSIFNGSVVQNPIQYKKQSTFEDLDISGHESRGKQQHVDDTRQVSSNRLIYDNSSGLQDESKGLTLISEETDEDQLYHETMTPETQQQKHEQGKRQQFEKREEKATDTEAKEKQDQTTEHTPKKRKQSDSNSKRKYSFSKKKNQSQNLKQIKQHRKPSKMKNGKQSISKFFKNNTQTNSPKKFKKDEITKKLERKKTKCNSKGKPANKKLSKSKQITKQTKQNTKNSKSNTADKQSTQTQKFKKAFNAKATLSKKKVIGAAISSMRSSSGQLSQTQPQTKNEKKQSRNSTLHNDNGSNIALQEASHKPSDQTPSTTGAQQGNISISSDDSTEREEELPDEDLESAPVGFSSKTSKDKDNEKQPSGSSVVFCVIIPVVGAVVIVIIIILLVVCCFCKKKNDESMEQPEKQKYKSSVSASPSPSNCEGSESEKRQSEQTECESLLHESQMKEDESGIINIIVTDTDSEKQSQCQQTQGKSPQVQQQGQDFDQDQDLLVFDLNDLMAFPRASLQVHEHDADNQNDIQSQIDNIHRVGGSELTWSAGSSMRISDSELQMMKTRIGADLELGKNSLPLDMGVHIEDEAAVKVEVESQAEADSEGILVLESESGGSQTQNGSVQSARVSVAAQENCMQQEHEQEEDGELTLSALL